MKTNFEHYKEKILDCKVNRDCLISKLRTNETGCKTDCKTCLLESLQWLFSEYKEPITMTLFEKSILECAVNHGYEWIARDSTDYLNIYPKKPLKYIGEWGITQWKDCLEMSLFEDKFQFIQWTDEEPTYIPDLLKECEVVEND